MRWTSNPRSKVGLYGFGMFWQDPLIGFAHQTCAGHQDIQTSQTTANLFSHCSGAGGPSHFSPPSFLEGHPDSPCIELNHVPMASWWFQGFR